MTTNKTIDGVPREDFTAISQAARVMAATTGTPGWGSAVKCFTMHCTPFVVIRMADEIERLRALLDVPALELVEPAAPWFYFVECDDPDYSGLYNHENEAQTQANDHGGEVIKLWNVPPTWKSAAQPQGEPVAWQFEYDGKWHNGDDRIKDHYKNTVNAGYKVRNLYAKQLAPVALELPERKQEDDPDFYDGPYVNHDYYADRGQAEGRNACLDEVTRLNK